MMEHFVWNLENKTILPINLRSNHVEKRTEPGHLEIDSIIGKKEEQQAIISIVDRCTRDNGLEFKALGIAAKRLGVKLYKCEPYLH